MSRQDAAPEPDSAVPDFAQTWVGRVHTRSSTLGPEIAGMLMGALGHAAASEPQIHIGAAMPMLWHWAAFPEFVPIAGIAPDGHPKLGGFLPPLPFARRMWAGGALTFKGQLAIGEQITRRSEILSVEFKSGSTGDMAFVRIGHDLRGEGGAIIREEQDIVYLPIPEQYRPPRSIPAPEAPCLNELVEVNPVRLFRYSAATYNAHRIHYDRDYATGAERYPGLVVHGPLQATLLMDAAVRHTGALPTRFSFRGVHPMFDGALHLQAVAEGAGTLSLCTTAPEGHQGLQARFQWEE